MSARCLKAVLAAVNLALLTACGSSNAPEAPEFMFLAQPAVADLPDAPLAKQLTLATNLNADVIADLTSDQGESFRLTLPVPRDVNPEGRVDIDVTLLGLRPARDYTMEVSAVTRDGLTAEAASPVLFSTGASPPDFPERSVVVEPDAENMEPGFTLFDARKKDGTANFVVVLDSEGEVTWFHRTDGPSNTRRLANGNLLVLDESNGTIRELDWRGEVQSETLGVTDFIKSYHSDQTGDPAAGSTPVDAENFHDDAFRSSSVTATYFTSTQSIESIENFPVDESDPAITGTANVLDEPIIEFDLGGNIVNRWALLELLDPRRIGYDGTSGLPDAADWAHVNTVIFDAARNSVIVSLRHQDAVISVSRSTGELNWILGTPDNWSNEFDPVLLRDDSGTIDWFFHQHGVSITPDGNILLFDNGNRRASPFTGQAVRDAASNNSRAVEYSLDLTEMQANEVWSWEMTDGGEMLYATTAGNAVRLPETGNTLITFGALCDEGGIPSDNLDACRTTARIIEVDTDTNATLFDVGIDSAPAESGYTVWRSERIPELYPPNTGTITPQ